MMNSPLIVRATVAAGLAVSLVAWAAHLLGPALALDDAFAVRSTIACGAALGVALAGLPGAHPFARLGGANLVTGGRLMIVALLAGIATAPGVPVVGWPAIGMTGLGAAADGLDGYLARRSGLASRFGARFDMEVDALLILVLSVLVWRAVPLGGWVLASGLMRYAFVMAGWMQPWLAGALPPSRRRQTVCVVQIVTLIAAVSPLATTTVALALTVTGLALLTWSFAIDTRWLFARRT